MADNLPEQQEEVGLKFPLTYDLKVIFSGSQKNEEHWENLKSLLDDLKISHENHRQRLSGEGKYTSITVQVEIIDRHTFDSLYKKINELKNFKCAI